MNTELVLFVLYFFVSGCKLFSYLNYFCFFLGKTAGLYWQIPQESRTNCSNYYWRARWEIRIWGQLGIDEKYFSEFREEAYDI